MKKYKSKKNSYLEGEILSISNYIQILGLISDEIKDYRAEFNLTQKDLAEVLDVNQAMVSKLEKGLYNPSIKFLTKLWNTLDTKSYNVASSMINKISNIVKESYELKYNNSRYENVTMIRKYDLSSNINIEEDFEYSNMGISFNKEIEVRDYKNYRDEYSYDYSKLVSNM